jgi:LysM repeat protein
MKDKKIIEEEIKKTKKEEIKKEEPKKVVEKREPFHYVLRNGETIESVAKKFNTTVEEIKKLNGDISPVPSNIILVK